MKSTTISSTPKFISARTRWRNDIRKLKINFFSSQFLAHVYLIADNKRKKEMFFGQKYDDEPFEVNWHGCRHNIMPSLEWNICE